jgi:mannose/fructose/N-acetylgalactosamine-specific phosphotransferase system component IID
VRTRLLLRSFLIQGCWNYRTMVGTGLAWALLPALKLRERDRQSRGETDGGADAVARHLGHFNGHPYLMTVALGALAREELNGSDPERVRRFRRVLPAPLGSLGDTAIWAAWRPACLLAALLAALLGAPSFLIVAGLLLAYNVVHLGVRIWGVRAGWAQGVEVGRALGAARFPVWAERIGRVGVLVLGLLLGLLLVEGLQAGGWGLFWLAGAAASLGVGLRGGASAGRHGSVLILVLILGGFIWGGLDGGVFSAGEPGTDP